METVNSIRPLLAVLVSLAAVPLIMLCRRPNLREIWTFVAAVTKLLLVVSMLPMVLGSKRISCKLFEVFPNVSIQFLVDPLGVLFALVASFLWLVTSAYSIGYMRGLDEHGQTRYFCFFAVALSATLGAAFSANLFTLYLFYEMLSLATYPLVSHHQDAEAKRSGRKYLVYIVGTSIGLVLPAMVWCYIQAGTLQFSDQGFMSGLLDKGAAAILLPLFLFGFAKAAVVPFHAWLPAAMVAPTPVSALLHAVAVVKVGVFSIVRVLIGVFGIDLLSSYHLGTAIGCIAAFTTLFGSLVALTQDELKRRLAFSTISQLSYIVLGVGLFSPRGILGGLLHIVMHAFGKITLFFCAGAIFVATGNRYISEMVGIGKIMPFTMAAFFVGALSVIGLPPTAGFLSKWNLLLGTLEAHQPVMLFVLLASSLLNAAYFLPIVYRAFFFNKAEVSFQPGIREAPLWCLVPLTLTALASILLFFYPQPFMRLSQTVFRAISGG